MIRLDDNIKDDELRVLGKPASEETKKAGHRWLCVILIVLGLVTVGAGIFMTVRNTLKRNVPDYYEAELNDSASTPIPDRFGDYSDTVKAYTEHLVKTINDIPLDIYIPHNAKPRLFIGTPDFNDRNVIFSTQAADIRADNGKINGAFVLAGVPKAWGLSKKGYCGIINGNITVGVADNSPLFEEATETGGYFFRQYPLVNDGVLVENEPKGKSIRKSICDRGGEILIVMTQEPESFHDFAQALIDLGASNAIYLVGGSSYGFLRDKDDQLSVLYVPYWKKRAYENHIQWVVDQDGWN